MKKVNCFYLSLTLLLLLLFSACQKEKNAAILTQEKSISVLEKVSVPSQSESISTLTNRKMPTDYNTFYGPQTQMGNGHARSWINITREGNIPLAIGIEFIPSAFENLPTGAMDFAASTFILQLHQKAMAITPFDHITINWEPYGHEPAHVYDVPHFDIHFYKISVADQLLISPMPTADPAPGYLPASYLIKAATVPQMGTHWLDPSSSELSPPFAPFTHTFVYGSTKGQVIFLEPMITKAFLLSGSYYETSFPQPMHFSPSGTNYPTAYQIWKSDNNGRHYVALTNFDWK